VPAIGILGGSFNPPHLGHLALARQAREQLALERVLVMPLHVPAHKPSVEDPGPEHRLAMCRLAVAGEPGVEACGLELERPGPSYTADTLSELYTRHPEAELTFIVGADTALTLPSWHEPRKVLELAGLAVAERPGTSVEDVIAALGGIVERPSEGVGTGLRIDLLSMSPMEVSSSRARERVAAGLTVDDMLGADVASYIADHGLYRAGAGAAT
jgi:nicotinate-nucleotide adenylyltransferase